MTGGKDMAAMDGPADGAVFAATIQPHRSLGPKGFRVVMTLCCIAMLGSSIPFVALGLWPVGGFFGLDLLALYIAFRVNYRRGGAVEQVVVTRLEVLLRRVSHRGQRAEWRFNPLWTRLDREDDAEFGLTKLALVSRGERVVIAGELSPGERESFADALGGALARVKRGY
jgi:uncharacterized membrane protein